ncbi:MAG: methyltransferase domain-containing protein [Proteobacteria bacterium]|nr:methyltransferase domain-containing protein [Pseudomonadota bacterium]MBU4296683.1 methyltransferase domain-containing protein [Pseudomonadota bacterium]MCG2748476.1 methyltransferase domain-containing protein [Desulfobulbaceae bacterium]
MAADNCDKRLYDKWDKRWQAPEDNERLTIVGRGMFKAKKKALLAVLQGIDPGAICEVGCGLGYTLGFLQEAGYRCVGIDVSANAVQECLRKGLNARLQKLEDVTEEFDLVSSDGMLEHFLNFEPYARHMMRISRKYVLLIQPNYDSLSGQALAFLANVLRRQVNVYEYNYRIRDFVSVFADNDFQLIDSRPVFFDVCRILLFERTEV